jgi:CxxC-x17-CxxC domain-containing protein
LSLQTKTLPCCECDKNFTFTIEEQETFQSKGHVNDPKRCPACRQMRKSQRATTLGSTGASNSYNSPYTPRQMFPAVCSDCGKATQVPFEPRNGKPVYCSDCYRKVRTV